GSLGGEPRLRRGGRAGLHGADRHGGGGEVIRAGGPSLTSPIEGGDELVEKDVAQPVEGLDADGVLEARQARLTRQVTFGGGPAGDDLEDGVGAEGVVGVLVLVVGQSTIDTGPNH